MMPRAGSLAARLSLYFALAAITVLSAAGWFLHQALKEQLQRRDDTEIVGKVVLLRHQLAEIASVESLRKDPQLLTNLVLGHDGLILVVQDAHGEVIARYGDESAVLPLAAPVPVGLEPIVGDVRIWERAGGGAGRTIAAQALVGAQPHAQVLMAIAREDSERMAILKTYQADIIAAVLGGALATALLGYAVAHRGLRPLRQVAQSARIITANQLGERLSAQGVPAEMSVMVGAFNDMLSRLEESFRRLSQFSADLAHDLRTPIGNLMVETQVALSQKRTVPEYEALLASNIEEFERLTRMVENMLFLARADNAQVALNKTRVDLGEEVRRIAEYFEGVAEEAGVTLQTEISVPAIEADVTMLRRALGNLIANALHYAVRGSQVIIRALEAPAAAGVWVEVINEGKGIAPEHRERIFDRFYRIEADRARSSGSSGLGLAIVKSVMTLHGGDAQLQVNDRHTTFRLVFPGEGNGAAS